MQTDERTPASFIHRSDGGEQNGKRWEKTIIATISDFGVYSYDFE